MHTRTMNPSGWGLATLILMGALAAPADASSLGTVTGYGSLGRLGQTGPNSEIVGGNASNHAFINGNGTTIDLGTLGGSTSAAAATDGKGQVVGVSNIAGDSAQHAFLYSNGKMSDLGTLGGTSSTATGINGSGQIVGQATNSSDNTHAFLYANGKMNDLGTLGGDSSSATGINGSGQVVGQSSLSDGSTHAFLYSGGSMADLGTLGGTSSFGRGINVSGQVVGQAYTAGDAEAHAVLWSHGVITDLGKLPGFDASKANAINAAGEIVGNAYGNNDPVTGAPIQHAFVYANGMMKDINALLPASSGWTFSQALSINDAGVVSGFGSYLGQRQAFSVVVPISAVPEPTALAVAGVMIAGFGARRFARRLYG